jgi:hypothetical protein
MLSAYTGNYALVIRPDNVWLAVISQFSLYVNANPELLRDEVNFVSHEPRKGQSLDIVDPNSQLLSAQIGELMQRTVLDPPLRDWFLPKFCIAWYHLLYPVVSRLAKSFNDANSPENLEFWKKGRARRGFRRQEFETVRLDYSVLRIFFRG